MGGNPAYPTSQDCPPDTVDLLPTIPSSIVPVTLSSGTVSWTATLATNDTGSTEFQDRVFSGFCRDVGFPGGTGSFDASAAAGFQFRQCWENGMAVGAPCSEAGDNSADTCEQRNNGAFGPNGEANMTIRAIGNAMSILGGPAPATLVSVFSLPPTFDPGIDSGYDFPGPGVVTMPGTARSCANAMSCP